MSGLRLSKVSLIPLVLGLVALLCISGFGVARAADDTLGKALEFSLLGLSSDGDIDVGVGNASLVKRSTITGGEIGAGGDLVFGNGAMTDGDAIAPGGPITLQNYASVAGKCVTNGSTVNLKVGAKCGSIDNSGSNPLLGLLNQADADSLQFACDVFNDSATSTLGDVKLGASKKYTITVSGGSNLFDLSSLILGNSSTLTIKGGASDTVVLRVTGDTRIGHNARILLGGGLTPNHVVIATQGGISFWGNSTTVTGTILDSDGTKDMSYQDCTAGTGTTINGALICGDDLTLGANARVNFNPADLVMVPKSPVCGNVSVGSCQPSSSLTVLVTGTNVVAYVPKGNWGSPNLGVSVANVEGSSITPTLIPTASAVNSCAANSVSGQTVCTANNTDVYLLSGTTLNSTLTSGGSGSISFSGGSCINCGVAMDATHNRAVIGLSVAGSPGFQFLNLGGSPSFEPAFKSLAGIISEDALIDPSRNLLLSAAENGNYEIIDITTSTSPAFFENATGGGDLDSSGEDCSTGIALAPAEFSSPSNVFIADLTQRTSVAGSPGTWSAPSQVQSLSESSLSAGASGIAVAQGTHLGVVSGEFGGDTITAIALPATSGSGTPAILDWVSCSIGSGFSNGFDPHTVTAYKSPNGAGDAIALLANGTASGLASVDLTQMLNTTTVPRTGGGHACASGTLPSTVVSFIPVL